MSWNATFRAIDAAHRRSIRESHRRQKELARQAIARNKLEAKQRAAFEVEEYENNIEVLLSIHKEAADPIDWQALASKPAPEEPKQEWRRKEEAEWKLKTFTPGFFCKLFGQTEIRRAQLASEVSKATKADETEFREREQAFRQELADWEETRALANGVLKGDGQSYITAIKELGSLSELAELGSSFTASAPSSGPLNISIDVHGEGVVPSEQKSLLSSGKLSTKVLPRAKLLSIYQDHVCGCVLRVAREIFALLPVDAVIVTARAEVMNSATGHLERVPIISAAISREKAAALNWETLDPSDCMRNFAHNMGFKKGSGFAPVEEVLPTH